MSRWTILDREEVSLARGSHEYTGIAMGARGKWEEVREGKMERERWGTDAKLSFLKENIIEKRESVGVRWRVLVVDLVQDKYILFFCFFDYPINLFIEFTASMQQVVVWRACCSSSLASLGKRRGELGRGRGEVRRDLCAHMVYRSWRRWLQKRKISYVSSHSPWVHATHCIQKKKKEREGEKRRKEWKKRRRRRRRVDGEMEDKRA